MLVCKQWRDICLCTPDLWSRISISPTEPESFEKVRRWLVRSKAVPLHVFLYFSSRSSFSAQAATQHSAQCHVTPGHLLKTSLQLLRPTIARWRTFVLMVPYRPQATAALALCSSPAPMLESLTLQVRPFSSPDDRRRIGIFIFLTSFSSLTHRCVNFSVRASRILR
jgi:hypothetical protein